MVPKRESFVVLLPPTFDKSEEVLNLDINLGLELMEGADAGGIPLLAWGWGITGEDADARILGLRDETRDPYDIDADSLPADACNHSGSCKPFVRKYFKRDLDTTVSSSVLPSFSSLWVIDPISLEIFLNF